MGRVRHDPFAHVRIMRCLRFLLLFFLDFDNFTTFVEAAVGANCMREAHGTAVRAGGQVAGL